MINPRGSLRSPNFATRRHGDTGPICGVHDSLAGAPIQVDEKCRRGVAGEGREDCAETAQTPRQATLVERGRQQEQQQQ